MGPFLPVNEQKAKEFGIKPQGPLPVTLRSKLIERPRRAWHAPVVTKCSTPFDNLPPIEEIHAAIQRFLNPKETSKPEVASGEARNR